MKIYSSDKLQAARQSLYHNIPLIVFVIISISLYMHFFINKGFFQVELQSDAKGVFKVYWAEENQAYNEKQSSSVRINRNQYKYNFLLANIKSIKKLRIDPINKAATVHIKRILIKQIGYEPVLFETMEQMKMLTPLQDIAEINNRQDGLEIITSGKDPQLEVYLRQKSNYNYFYPVEIIKIIFIALFLTILFSFFKKIISNYNYIPYLLLFAIALILVMASVSKDNQHPDEYVHTKAAIYYQDHWAPPEVCSPDINNTFSVHGHSRLNSYEIVYFLAGKFSRFLSFIPMNQYFRLRLFNILLFIIILLLSFKNEEYRIVCATLLISPQIWYVFSYFNSDAFSMFIIFIISYQILNQKSLLNSYLLETDRKRLIIYSIIIGLLFSMLFFIKKNFYIFILFLFLYFLLRLYNNEFINTKMAVKRVCLIILIAAAFLGFRYSVDIYINGFNKTEKLLECQEKHARPQFKISTKLEDKYFGKNLKARGLSLKDMFKKYNWGNISFQSAFGVYGYMSIYASKAYNETIKILLIVFTLYIISYFLLKSGIYDIIFLLIVLACSFLLIGASLWNSWTADLQAQGRYFLPIFTMFGFLLLKCDRFANKHITNIFIILMFLMSSYSFIFIGLINIPKY